MQIGYKASAEQFDPKTLAQYAVRAEQVGLDSVFVSDHVQPWRVTGGHAPNALAWLGYAAACTERVTLGTSVLTPTYRYNPVVIAQTFATLGVLAPDRVVLGVGTGEALNEIAIGAIEAGHWPDFKERFGRLREAVRLIRALWTDEVVDFEGDYYRTQGARIFDRPEQPVPIYIAAGGPTMAKYAGRAGDGFICTSGKGMSLYADKLVPAVAEGRAAANKPEQGLARMIEIKLSYDPDPAQALENTRFWAPLSLDAEAKHSIHDPAEMEAAADALPIEQIASRWIVASTPDEVLAALQPYVDLGFDHLVFHAPGADQDRFLTSFAEQVLPAVRELTPAKA